jgi:hypothetical protein
VDTGSRKENASKQKTRTAAVRPSGRESFPIRLLVIEEGHCLEPVIARPAIPEIGHAARAGFDPLGGGDRLAALSAGIFLRQIAGVNSGHGASPFCFLMFEERIDV